MIIIIINVDERRQIQRLIEGIRTMKPRKQINNVNNANNHNLDETMLVVLTVFEYHRKKSKNADKSQSQYRRE